MGSRSQGSMASVRVFLYSAVLYLASASSCHNYGDWGCSPRSRHVVSRGHHHHYEAPVVEKRVHVTHEVHHIVHKRRRRPRPVVHVVEDTRPEVVVVDQPAIVAPAAPPVQPYYVRAPVRAAAVVPSAYAPPYGTGTIDPRLVPVLRGSTPQQGDPLGIHPGGGLDPRIDPSLVPVARNQLEDQVRVLKDQLDVLTRRLGVPLASGSRTAEDL